MTYVLVPGAGGEAWYWHLVAPLLDDAIAVELPTGDPDAGLQDYADAITEAAGDRERVTLVAQSMGAFSAPMAKLDVERIILVAPMIPAPGRDARRVVDHVRPARRGRAAVRPESRRSSTTSRRTSGRPRSSAASPSRRTSRSGTRGTLDAWPDVPTG